MALKTDIDDFHVQGREVYWLCRVKQSDSKFSNVVLEKTLGHSLDVAGSPDDHQDGGAIRGKMTTQSRIGPSAGVQLAHSPHGLNPAGCTGA